MGEAMNIVSINNILWLSTYDIRPAKLFVGVDQRLAIYINRPSDTSLSFNTCYNRWNEDTRSLLFSGINFIDISTVEFSNSLAKMGNSIENKIWNRLIRYKNISHFFGKKDSITFHNAPRYWIRAMDFVPYFWNEKDGEKQSVQVKSLSFLSSQYSKVIVATLNSTIFYWWFILLSDCRHLNMREIEHFPIGLDQMKPETMKQLSDLSDYLMQDLKMNAYRKRAFYKTTGQVEYDEFYPKLSKAIIDEIDRVLAQHYGFTEEELDFIINYDIKYRMGDELGGDDGDA